MTAEARFFPRARLDLIEQAEYLLDEAGPEVCDRFLEASRATADSLLKTPQIGRAWQSAEARSDSAIRIWPVRGFSKILLFYRPDLHGISVIRVLHSARDLPPLMEGYA